jgi:phosphatidylglycerophosphatase C
MGENKMTTTYTQSSIAFFDFDGTITHKDTLPEVLKFIRGKVPYYIGIILLSPVILAHKLHFISPHAAKEQLLRYFLRGIPVDEFNVKCKEFVETRMQRLFRKSALAEIRKHLQSDTRVVVVTASPENWVRPWCQQFNIECIATKLKVSGNGMLTGTISGQDCSGEEKVRSILKKYNLSHFSKIYAYGDSPGDLRMLSLATDSYYKPFKERAY